MNVQNKSNSCIPSSTITIIFKEFLAKASKICYEEYLNAEIGYLTDTLYENEYDRKTLQKVINNFENKTRSISSNSDNSTDKKQIIT